MAEEILGFEFQTRLQGYLNNELSEEERAVFESLLQSSAEARAEYQFSRDLYLAQHHGDAVLASIAIREGIEAAQQSSVGSSKVDKPFWVWRFSIGLLLVGSLFLGWWGYAYQVEQARIRNLVQGYLQPLENVLLTNEKKDPLLDVGMQAYLKGDYSLAAERLAAYTALTGDRNSQLYLGISLAFAGEQRQAIQRLEELCQAGEQDPAAESARWYLALLYLQQGSKATGLRLLEQVRASGLYQAEARQLLEAINQEQ